MQNKLNQSKLKNDLACERIELANSCGVRLIYCQYCQVVELEIGAVCVRLCPDVIQRMANVMMKASLELEHVAAVNNKLHNKLLTQARPQMIH
jgi:hypothetical protein